MCATAITFIVVQGLRRNVQQTHRQNHIILLFQSVQILVFQEEKKLIWVYISSIHAFIQVI